MAKRSTTPPPPQEVELTPSQMRAAISRFERRLRDLEEFDPTTIKDRRDPRIDALETSIDEALSETFGHGTHAYQLYARAKDLDTAGINFNGTPHHEVIEGLGHGKDRATVLLKQAIRSFEEKIGDQEQTDPPKAKADRPDLQANSRDIFVVHGHDATAKNEVARLIERAGLNAVILHEQPNGGRTIIEKFEAHGGAAGFAVVLLTADDVGGVDVDHLRPRARQNVVGEMFWLAGKLGRTRVCALKKGDVELPSDFAGVGYTEMDDRGAWKSELMKELQAAGYADLNWAKALA